MPSGPGASPGGMPEFFGPVGGPPAVQVFGLPEPRPKADEYARGALVAEASVHRLRLCGGESWGKADAGEKRHRHGHQNPVRFVASAVAKSGADRAPGNDVGHGRSSDHACAQRVCKGGGQAVAPASDLHEVGPFGQEGTWRNRCPLPVSGTGGRTRFPGRSGPVPAQSGERIPGSGHAPGECVRRPPRRNVRGQTRERRVRTRPPTRSRASSTVTSWPARKSS